MQQIQADFLFMIRRRRFAFWQFLHQFFAQEQAAAMHAGFYRGGLDPQHLRDFFHRKLHNIFEQQRHAKIGRQLGQRCLHCFLRLEAQHVIERAVMVRRQSGDFFIPGRGD